MIELYRRIWAISAREQIVLIILSLLIAALAAMPLQFQKTIINGLTESMDRNRLLILCIGYLGVVLLTSSFRFAMDYRSAVLSENVIRRIRGRIYNERMNLSGSDKDPRGKLVTMIASEAEELGRYAGHALAEPLLQFGTLVSVIAFIAATQPFLGLLLVLVILPQAVIVMSLQKRVNERVAEHLQVLRRATGRITAEELATTQQAILDDFDKIFEIQRRSFGLKISMKFALHIIFGLGVVGIMLLGGLLFLDGRTDIGSVVASLTALHRVNDPWHALISIFREVSAVRVRYDLLATA